MKVFLGLAIFLFFFSNCSAPPAKNVAAANSNSNSNNSADNSVSRVSNTNNTVPPPEITNTGNSAPAGKMISPGLLTDAKKKSKGKFAAAAPLDPNAERILAPAPDNSEISTAMNKQGQIIETRTFKDNAELAKVVRMNVDSDNQAVKVYLKNGKILDLPKGRIENIFAAPAAQILQAVGVASQKTKPVRENVEKKAGQ